MKHPRRLTKSEKIILVGQGLDPKKYQRVKRVEGKTQFVNVITKETHWEPKENESH